MTVDRVVALIAAAGLLAGTCITYRWYSTEWAVRPVGAVVWNGWVGRQQAVCLSTDGGKTAGVVPLTARNGAALRRTPFAVSNGRFVYWSPADVSLCVLDGSGAGRRWIALTDRILKEPHVYVDDLTPWPGGVALNLVDQRTWSRLGALAVCLADGTSGRIADAAAVRGADGSDCTCALLPAGGFEVREGDAVAASLQCGMAVRDWDFEPRGPTVCVTDGSRVAVLQRGSVSEWDAPYPWWVRGVFMEPSGKEMLLSVDAPFHVTSTLMAVTYRGRRLGNRLRSRVPVDRPVLSLPPGTPAWWPQATGARAQRGG